MNFSFLGNKDPYGGMLPGMTDTEIAQLAAGGAPNQMIANAQMGGMRNFAPVDKAVPGTAPTPVAGGMNMGQLGAGLSALGGLLGSGQEQAPQPAPMAPVPPPPAVAVKPPSYAPMGFDFGDYLRKRQMGIL